MNKVEFDRWAWKMLGWKPKHYSCWQIPNSNIVLCVNQKNGKVGIARCHPDDQFVLTYGKAIAIARCAGKEVPTLTTYKKMSELKNGDTFKYDNNTIYRYIGRINDTTFAVVDTFNSRLHPFHAYDAMEVEMV